MQTITVSVRKTVQECPYEPFDVGLTAQFSPSKNPTEQEIKSLEKKMEGVLDDMISERLILLKSKKNQK